ncbi:MAG: hypothetical protein K2Q34_08800 [Alphaproteobacteria bacterium]|nr:hypothetical protein [Alphaproteobacteria bacterium]
MDIISYIEEDYQEAEKLIKYFKLAKTKEEKQILFKKLSEHVNNYNKKEEKLFYEVMSKIEEARNEAHRSYEEHKILASLLEDMLPNMQTHINENWEVKIDTFQEFLATHYRQKQRTLFPLARRHLTKERLISLGLEYKKSHHSGM